MYQYHHHIINSVFKIRGWNLYVKRLLILFGISQLNIYIHIVSYFSYKRVDFYTDQWWFFAFRILFGTDSSNGVIIITSTEIYLKGGPT